MNCLHYKRWAVFLQFTVLLAFALAAPLRADDVVRPEPEPDTGLVSQQAVTGQKFMAVTAHPYATAAAYEILQAGGTAADAAIAAQLVLGLVEPQSSGLGGGGFAVYYDADRHEISTYDGREVAPLAAGPDLFLRDDGSPMDFYEAAMGGRAVGVPGLPQLLEQLHRNYGGLEWQRLFDSAVTLAEGGFEITPRLATMIEGNADRLRLFEDTAELFFNDDDMPLKTGDVIRNLAYADTLHLFREQGAAPFYTGAIAEAIVEAVRSSPHNPGLLTMEDMAAYRVIQREPVCGSYQAYMLCSIGPPSSGGVSLLQILGMLQYFDTPRPRPRNVRGVHFLVETSRLAFADRNAYIADPDFVTVDTASLLHPDYLQARSRLIRQNRAMAEVSPGTPPSWGAPEEFAPDNAPGTPGTTHLSIVDQYGNVLSMTTTIEGAFGAHIMAAGFLLNNQLTDFSFLPEIDGRMVANRVDGGKRPRSSMAPVILFHSQGHPLMAIGSAGGSRIIGYVAQRILAVTDWRMDLQAALDMPHILSRGDGVELEEGFEALAAPLQAMGHSVDIAPMNSGLTAIMIDDGLITGAADPRREGIAMGE